MSGILPPSSFQRLLSGVSGSSCWEVELDSQTRRFKGLIGFFKSLSSKLHTYKCGRDKGETWSHQVFLMLVKKFDAWMAKMKLIRLLYWSYLLVCSPINILNYSGSYLNDKGPTMCKENARCKGLQAGIKVKHTRRAVSSVWVRGINHGRWGWDDTLLFWLNSRDYPTYIWIMLRGEYVVSSNKMFMG